MRILVAMSGGVDSAVAAARLVDEGHDVVGVTLHLWDYPEEGDRAHARCCAPEDQYDAKRTADALGIPHYTFDRRELFAKTVVGPFVEAYLAGDTPSPCTACNRGVKIRELVALADRLGAERVATGHYARLGRTADGIPFVREGADDTKDQSYFLYASKQAELERLVFPLGDAKKGEVRAEAIARKLPGANKGESQELCFVGAGAGAYAAFVEERSKARIRPGNIVDRDGRVVATHEGVHRFTIGQRKGLGVALGKPAFVTSIDAATATVRLGTEDDLASSVANVEDVVLAPGVSLPFDARVRVRYRHEGALGSVRPTSGAGVRATIAFAAPVRAVSRGQAAVFYDGDRVLGGARIS
jgi:tRNA-uridine 2-sulfurtransferase